MELTYTFTPSDTALNHVGTLDMFIGGRRLIRELNADQEAAFVAAKDGTKEPLIRGWFPEFFGNPE